MDEEDENPVMKGTPITRGGGHLIRVGWWAKGYSVSSSTAGKYKLYSWLLLLAALIGGFGGGYGVCYIYFEFAEPLAYRVIPSMRYYPMVVEFLIFLTALLVSFGLYWHTRVKVGEALVKGATKLHDGYDPIDQRRRGSLKRKRAYLFHILLLIGVATAPIEIRDSLRWLVMLIPIYFLGESIVLRFVWKA